MPPEPKSKQDETLVYLRGSPQYARYLARLGEAVRARGVQVDPDSHHALAEYALAVLGLQHGLKAPPRARRRGRPSKEDQ